MDPLVEIPKSDLPKLRDLFRTNWPYGVEGYCLLTTQLSRPALTDIYNFKFYCPEGDISNGMIAISDTHYDYEVYICPITDNGIDVIENALAKTKIIDWNREITVPSTHPEVMDCLTRLRDEQIFKISNTIKLSKHLLSRDTEPFENLEPPENTYVDSLRPEHLNLVNLTWSLYNGQGSFENFKTLMENGLFFVLYSSEDHKPAAWIAIDNEGTFCHLYCLGVHRRKGYGEYIARVAANSWLKEGHDVLAYTLEENFKSRSLFDKMGFDFLGYIHWMYLTKDK